MEGSSSACGGCGGFGFRSFGFRGMGCALKILFGHKKLVLAAAATVYGVVKVAKHVRMKKLRAKWAAAGKDVVVLHTIPRSYYSPCLTPFSVKLETFFRMMDIKYELDFEEPMGPKNKVPWITVNGEDYADSELIIQKLQVMFNKFPDANVPKEDRAVGLAMRVMLEEHLYWGLVSWRYVEDDLKGLMQVHHFPPFLAWAMRSYKGKLKESLYLQGIGRHSYEEIHALMKRDLEALSVYLGNKDFLLGSTPQLVDCSVFSFIVTLLYTAPNNPYLLWMEDEFPNLRAYTERVKQCYWPDWNLCITKPETTL